MMLECCSEAPVPRHEDGRKPASTTVASPTHLLQRASVRRAKGQKSCTNQLLLGHWREEARNVVRYTKRGPWRAPAERRARVCDRGYRDGEEVAVCVRVLAGGFGVAPERMPWFNRTTSTFVLTIRNVTCNEAASWVRGNGLDAILSAAWGWEW